MRRYVATTLVAAALAVTLGACGRDAATAQLVPVEPPTTQATTSSLARPTTTTTSTTTTTTSTTTTTVPRQLTQPIAPPEDARAAENNPPIGRIAIEAIGLDAELEEGIRLTTLDRGPGHWPGSAMPGEIGNVVIGGHRTSHGAEFRHLDKLVPGDTMTLTSADGTFTYVVASTEIVGPEALWIIAPSDDATATLFACHPLGSTAQRIVVHLTLAT